MNESESLDALQDPVKKFIADLASTILPKDMILEFSYCKTMP